MIGGVIIKVLFMLKANNLDVMDTSITLFNRDSQVCF